MRIVTTTASLENLIRATSRTRAAAERRIARLRADATTEPPPAPPPVRRLRPRVRSRPDMPSWMQPARVTSAEFDHLAQITNPAHWAADEGDTQP